MKATGATRRKPPPPTPTTPLETTSCQQVDLKVEFEQLAAYIAQEKAPEALCNAILGQFSLARSLLYN